MRNEPSAGCELKNPKSAIRNPKSRGVSLIAAIFIIVILGFMGVMFVSLINTGSFTAVNDLKATQAFFIAEGGLERAVRFLDSPILDPTNTNLDRRRACASVTGDVALTNVALGPGQFTVTTEAGSPFYPANPVTFANIAGTTINVSADPIARGYAASGRIMIDRELIDYAGTLGNSFTNVVRGKDGSAVSVHANGAPVGQYQCSITSNGGIPDLAAPRAQRAVREGVQLQEGWAVGGGGLPTDNLNSVYCTGAANCWALGDAGTILRWNSVGWSQLVSPTVENLNEVHCADANNCWAVGNAGGVAAERPLLLQWDGAAWAIFNSGLNINEDLNGVSCSAPDYCWAVGTPGGANPRQPLLLNWNAGAWAAYDSSAINISATLNSVSVIPTMKSWAVGDRLGNGANDWFFVRRTAGLAGIWSRIVVTTAGISAQNLNSVSMVPSVPPDGWAVGNRIANATNGWTFFRWNDGGDTWNRVVVTTAGTNAQNLNDVFMIPGGAEGWAVGNRTGAAMDGWILLRYNAGAWARVVVNTLGTNAENLNAVTCTANNNCWAVGDAGLILHWDGAAWTLWQQANATLLRWRDVAWNDTAGMLPVGVNRLRSVSMLSYADVWATGDRRGCAATGPTVARWNGVNWACTTGALATPDQNLRSIFMLSSTDGWAVGNSNGARPSAIRWNTPCGGGVGTGTWNDCTNAAFMPAVNQPLRSVYMLSSADGWAVGSRAGGVTNGWLFMRWNNPAANTWNRIIVDTAPTIAQNLNAVYLVFGGNDGWAVGNRVGGTTNGWTFFRWNGAAWNRVVVNTAAVARNLNSVFMLDMDNNGIADDGWAVGDSNGVRPVVLRWNIPCAGGAGTGTWNDCTNAPYVPAVNQNLNWVFMVGADDGWAAGDGGLLLHWDGAAWALVAVPTVQNLDSMYLIGPRRRPQAAWQEVIQ